jgi:nucleotide-binding universal stress UspA family protein
MASILCCVRGGEASVETQRRSIALAKELNKEIVFFMAYDVEFMAHANYALHADIVSDEMAEMCDFLLNMAVERAMAEGVKARSIVRSGSFAEQIREVAAEISPSLVILGHPGPEEDGERLEELQSLCRALQAELKIEFRILPEIEVHHPE